MALPNMQSPGSQSAARLDNGQPRSALTPADLTAVEELCHILARVLMRINADHEQASSAEGDNS